MDMKNQLMKEKEFLDNVVGTYKTDNSPFNSAMQEFIIKTFSPFFNDERESIGLQLGCCDRYQIDLLAKCLNKLDIIEGSQIFIDRAKQWEYKNVNYIYSLFEEFEVPGNYKYDYIFATYVLEHVIDVQLVLEKLKSVLKPDGYLFIVVPNARALSRQLAVYMGLFNDLKSLTENDIHHGHRRVYDRVSFNKDLETAGFKIVSQGGLIFKFLADFQMNQLIEENILQKDHLEGLYKLGLEYPDFSGSLFAICKIND